MKSRWSAFGLFALCLAFVAAKWPTRWDPPYWDSLGCYVQQVRFIAAHGLDWHAYHSLPLIRPPLYTASLAAITSLGGHPLLVMHVATWWIGAAGLPAVYLIARRLGGCPAVSLGAAAICALTPIYAAQAGLILADLPVTVWVAWAFVFLLSGRNLAFIVCASLAVLTKEIAFFVCFPAAIWVYSRSRGGVLRAWPMLIPGAVLAGWILLHGALTGDVMHQSNRDAIGFHFMPDALIHNFLEGGRLWLWLLALLSLPKIANWRRLKPALRPEQPELARELVILTLATAASLPLFFPGPLPRYMLPSLPLLAAAAAVGLSRLKPPFAWAGSILTVVILLSGWWGPSWHVNGGHHLDANLHYRDSIWVDREAVRALAALRPRSVLSTFPTFFELVNPPEDGYLPAPVHAVVANGNEPLDVLYQNDFLVQTALGIPIDKDKDRLTAAGALEQVGHFGPPDLAVDVYRIHSPPH